MPEPPRRDVDESPKPIKRAKTNSPRLEYVREGFRYIVGKSRHRAHTESQREESGESQFLGSLWRATLSREAWMPIWGLSTESMSPGRLPVVARLEPSDGDGAGSTGVPGGHDTHRPFTNRKAAPGEGTVIRARVGRPIPFRARSAQGPVHFPPTWRVMMRRCHPGQPGQGRRARAEGGMGAKREGANGVERTDGGWRRRRGGKGGGRREGGSRHGRAVGGSVGRGGGRGVE